MYEYPSIASLLTTMENRDVTNAQCSISCTHLDAIDLLHPMVRGVLETMTSSLPTVIDLDMTGIDIFHQSKYFLCDGIPIGNFAYFSLKDPYYDDSSYNVYRYRYRCTIPRMVRLDDHFWPEDLYAFVQREVGHPIPEIHRALNDGLISLGYGGWYNVSDNEYIVSREIFQYFVVVDAKVESDSEDPVYDYTEYYI